MVISWKRKALHKGPCSPGSSENAANEVSRSKSISRAHTVPPAPHSNQIPVCRLAFCPPGGPMKQVLDTPLLSEGLSCLCYQKEITQNKGRALTQAYVLDVCKAPADKSNALSSRWAGQAAYSLTAPTLGESGSGSIAGLTSCCPGQASSCPSLAFPHL